MEHQIKKLDEKKCWIGVDLDGTLAYFDFDKYKEQGVSYIGYPIVSILNCVKYILKHGAIIKLGNNTLIVHQIKIFTSRAGNKKCHRYITKWLLDNGLPALEITNIKDKHCVEIWDDRARQIEYNRGTFA